MTNENELTEKVNAFYNLFSSVCDLLFKKKKRKQIVKNCIKNTDDTKHQKWFDEGCHAKRKVFL